MSHMIVETVTTVTGSANTLNANTITANNLTVGGSNVSSIANNVVANNIATVAEIRAGTSTKLFTVNAYTQALAEVPITFTSTITPNGQAGINFAVSPTSNLVLANFTNPVAGYTYTIRIAHAATGVTITSWGNHYKSINGAKPVLSVGNGDTDILMIKYYTSNSALVWLARDIS